MRLKPNQENTKSLIYINFKKLARSWHYYTYNSTTLIKITKSAVWTCYWNENNKNNELVREVRKNKKKSLEEKDSQAANNKNNTGVHDKTARKNPESRISGFFIAWNLWSAPLSTPYP